MAELVSEAFLSAAFGTLLQLLASSEFRNFFQGKKSIDKQLGLLNEKLKTASLLLNDAEDKQITDQKVKEWLDELKDVIFRADDLVEEIKAEVRSKQECEYGSSTSTLKKMVAFLTPFTEFDKTVQGEIEHILTELNFILERASTLHLKHIDSAQNARSSQRSPAPLLEECQVHGRNDDKEKILKLLLSNEDWGNKIGVMPIVGMGGLGKTTLARLVYDDDRVKKHDFQHKAWVTVSIEFDISRITKLILQQVSPQMMNSIEEPMELQGRLKEALRGKKFLFVLDDVWDENYSNWVSLNSGFMSGDCGSRIIVTTRSQKVASNVKTRDIVHELQQVSNKACWKIFLDHAFDGNPVIDPCLQEIGEQIVAKCKGLPLAVRSLGGFLHSERNPEIWESILKSHVWSKNLGNDILPGLWLSYCCLPSRLKQCFSYCSIFPKGYEFEKKDIILLWMAEGFLQSDEKEKTMEEVGKDYFDELMARLMARSLFQRSSQDKFRVLMHDLVHDLAMFVSGEVCFRFGDATSFECLTKLTRYMSTDGAPIDHELWKGRFEAKNLRSFIRLDFSNFHEELVREVLKGGRCLRVLSQARGTKFQMLHDSFNKLKHLRYLDLSWSEIEEIPCSICTLYNLQTLLLSNCKKLSQFPKDMGRLIHLRHLDTTDTPLEEMPPHMGNLKELQTLTNFVLGEPGRSSGIKELGPLQHLAGRLRISGLQNYDNVDVLEDKYLKYKEKLTELAFEWQGEVTDTRRAKEALNALQPHTSLMKLDICTYAGLNFPRWLGDPSFSKLVSVFLSGNEYCLFLPPLGQLPSLQKLVIKSFHAVEKIGAEFYIGNYSSISPFQRLEILIFSDMKSWKEWSFICPDGKEGKCFPRLKVLSLDGCPNQAASFPDSDTIEVLKIFKSCKLVKCLQLNNFPKLKKLELLGCENLKELILELPNVIDMLYIRDCKKLEFIGNHHFVHVKKLTIDGCDSLNSLPLDYFPTELSIWDCQKLVAQHKHWDLQGLTCLTSLEIDSCEAVLDSFPDALLPCSLTSFKLKNIPHLKSLNGSAFQNVTSLETLEIKYCDELQFLPGEVLLPSFIRCLNIYECTILEQRYRRGEGKDWHKISHIPTIHIDGRTTKKSKMMAYVMAMREESASTSTDV